MNKQVYLVTSLFPHVNQRSQEITRKSRGFYQRMKTFLFYESIQHYFSSWTCIIWFLMNCRQNELFQALRSDLLRMMWDQILAITGRSSLELTDKHQPQRHDLVRTVLMKLAPMA